MERRQADSLARDIPKLFAFSSTLLPFNEKIGKLLIDLDQNDLRALKESKSIEGKLHDLSQCIGELRETLKFYEQSN